MFGIKKKYLYVICCCWFGVIYMSIDVDPNKNGSKYLTFTRFFQFWSFGQLVNVKFVSWGVSIYICYGPHTFACGAICGATQMHTIWWILLFRI